MSSAAVAVIVIVPGATTEVFSRLSPVMVGGVVSTGALLITVKEREAREAGSLFCE